MCKVCVCVRNKAYWQTPYGRISYIINTQKTNSRVRGHVAPDYTQNELYDWACEQGLLSMVAVWAAAGYDKQLTPSIDRLDTTHGYTLGNIRLVTWKENNDAQYSDRKTCKVITKQNKKVRQLSMAGVEVAIFDSIAAAARATGAVRTNINCMCTGTNQAIKSVGGYLWEYVT